MAIEITPSDFQRELCKADFHLYESLSLYHDLFRVLKCVQCGHIDPCGVPEEYLTEILADEVKRRNN